MSMVSLQPVLASLLKSLPPRPIEQTTLNELVKETITQSQTKTSAENRKSQWEYLLKNEIFLLAVRSSLYNALKFQLIETQGN